MRRLFAFALKIVPTTPDFDIVIKHLQIVLWKISLDLVLQVICSEMFLFGTSNRP
jgi:hypothetical protein